jgi:flagellar basal-body rod protein FlgG
LVTQDGLIVQPGIAIPQNTLSVTINAQGQVNALVAGNSTAQTVGQLELTRFPNEAGMNSIGNNLYLETPGSGSPQAGVPGTAGYGTIQQGYLETSNVNSVDEITSLITAQRAYEMNSKVITAADQMLQDAARLGS